VNRIYLIFNLVHFLVDSSVISSIFVFWRDNGIHIAANIPVQL